MAFINTRPIIGNTGVTNSMIGRLRDPGASVRTGLFSFYPKANRFPTDQYNTNNYFFQGLQTFRSQTINSRVDLNHGKHNLYFAGGIEWGTIIRPAPGERKPLNSMSAPGGNSQITALVYSHAPYGSIGDTIAVSPTLIIDARFGVQRTHYINMNPVVSGVNYNNFSMPSTIQAILPQPGAAPDFGTVPIGQWTALNDLSNGTQERAPNELSRGGQRHEGKGNWTLKWGGEYLGGFNQYSEPLLHRWIYWADGCGGCQYTNTCYGSVSQNTTAATQGLAYMGDVMHGRWLLDILSAHEHTVPRAGGAVRGLYRPTPGRLHRA